MFSSFVPVNLVFGVGIKICVYMAGKIFQLLLLKDATVVTTSVVVARK